MASIATQHGDRGQTSLIGGARVSKSALRVEAYGTVDELNSAIGFARSICGDQTVCESALKIQRELFRLGASLATPADARKSPLPLDATSLDALTAEVHALENSKEITIDWSIPGGSPASAAFDMARTVCRRAERCVVRLSESEEEVEPLVLSYLNRLSDLLWLFGRKLDENTANQSLLRTLNSKQGPNWSRAW